MKSKKREATCEMLDAEVTHEAWWVLQLVRRGRMTPDEARSLIGVTPEQASELRVLLGSRADWVIENRTQTLLRFEELLARWQATAQD
jgi:hypothetical protein